MSRPAFRAGHCKILVLLLAALAALTGGSSTSRAASVGDFDFYVLALTWLPGFCLTQAGKADPKECARPEGFLVHGLWPQFESGYPKDCDTAAGHDRAAEQGVRDIMPSAGLAGYEWRTHGTCTGLDEKAYFDQERAAFARIRFPPTFHAPEKRIRTSPAAVEQAFVRANPGLDRSAIAVECRGGVLTGVRICLGKDLSFRSCGEIDGQTCRMQWISAPPPAR